MISHRVSAVGAKVLTLFAFIGLLATFNGCSEPEAETGSDSTATVGDETGGGDSSGTGGSSVTGDNHDSSSDDQSDSGERTVEIVADMVDGEPTIFLIENGERFEVSLADFLESINANSSPTPNSFVIRAHRDIPTSFVQELIRSISSASGGNPTQIEIGALHTDESTTNGIAENPIEISEAVGDDPAAIAELEALGVSLTLNDAGQVIKADCKAAALNDEQALKLVPFTQLADLSLENAAVTDAGLDAVLSQMPQIKILSLRRCNQLTDAGFAALSKLPNLERALLLYTNISNDGLAHLASLTQLRVLDLRGCVRIGNAGMAHLAGLVNLVDLKLRCTGLYDTGVGQLAGLTKLRSLSLEDGRVTDAGAVHLAGMIDLRQLNLNRTAVTDACFVNFAGMTQLQDLRLRGTSARGPGLDQLPDSVVEKLTFLELSENRLTDADLSHVARFVNLKTLDLWASTVTDAGLVHLAGMHQIEDLNLDSCPVTSAGMSQLADLTTLKVLNLSRTQIDDAALEPLTALTNLTQLSIENVTNITPEAVARFQEALPNCTIKR